MSPKGLTISKKLADTNFWLQKWAALENSTYGSKEFQE